METLVKILKAIVSEDEQDNKKKDDVEKKPLIKENKKQNKLEDTQDKQKPIISSKNKQKVDPFLFPPPILQQQKQVEPLFPKFEICENGGDVSSFRNDENAKLVDIFSDEFKSSLLNPIENFRIAQNTLSVQINDIIHIMMPIILNAIGEVNNPTYFKSIKKRINSSQLINVQYRKQKNETNNNNNETYVNEYAPYIKLDVKSLEPDTLPSNIWLWKCDIKKLCVNFTNSILLVSDNPKSECTTWTPFRNQLPRIEKKTEKVVDIDTKLKKDGNLDSLSSKKNAKKYALNTDTSLNDKEIQLETWITTTKTWKVNPDNIIEFFSHSPNIFDIHTEDQDNFKISRNILWAIYIAGSRMSYIEHTIFHKFNDSDYMLFCLETLVIIETIRASNIPPSLQKEITKLYVTSKGRIENKLYFKISNPFKKTILKYIKTNINTTNIQDFSINIRPFDSSQWDLGTSATPKTYTVDIEFDIYYRLFPQTLYHNDKIE